MSFRDIQGNNTPARTLKGTTTVPDIKPWTRNPAWPVLIPPSSSEQKVVGLYAVFPGDGVGNGGNFFAINCAGAYTVDYGDGTSVNTATGVQTNYEYNFANANLYDATVTFTDAGDLVNRTEHGYNDGDTVQFYRIAATTGLTEAQYYFVIGATTHTFQVSTTIGGSAVALTTNGSAALLPYKIATVTITPQAGQNLTTVNFNVKNSTTGLQTYSTGWLDLAIAGSNITTLTIGGPMMTSPALPLVLSSNLERVNIVNANSVSSFVTLFYQLVSLREVKIDNTAALTDTKYMFAGCISLETVPLFNTASVTNMSGMFSGCTSLKTVPLFNTASVTRMGDTEVTFQLSLGMFASCISLGTVPLFSTALVTNMRNMFNGCISLKTVPLFNTASVTDMTSMFSGCTSLETVPLFNTASATNMSNMFLNCISLKTVPLFNTASVTSPTGMFRLCRGIASVPALNFTASTSFFNTFSTCNSLSRIEAANFRFTFSVANCKLSAAALDEIYTNLPTVTGQTITVTNNYGNVSDTPSIATAKGWTVNG